MIFGIESVGQRAGSALAAGALVGAIGGAAFGAHEAYDQQHAYNTAVEVCADDLVAPTELQLNENILPVSCTSIIPTKMVDGEKAYVLPQPYDEPELMYGLPTTADVQASFLRSHHEVQGKMMIMGSEDAARGLVLAGFLAVTVELMGEFSNDLIRDGRQHLQTRAENKTFQQIVQGGEPLFSDKQLELYRQEFEALSESSEPKDS